MKILLVVHGYPPEKVGGTETYTRNLARELAKNHDITVFTRTATEGEEYEVVARDEEGVEIRAIRNRYKLHHDYELHYRNPHIESAFADTLDRNKPDVVHFTYLLGGLSASYVAMAVERKIRSVITLTDFHPMCAWGQLLMPDGSECLGPDEGLRCSRCFAGEDPYARLGWWSRWRMKRLPFEEQAKRLDAPGLTRMNIRGQYLRGILKAANVVISPTEYLQNVYNEWGVNSIVIPFGIDKLIFKNFRRKPSDAFRLVFIGRLAPLKGLHILVQALSDLKINVQPWKLYIYADDSGEEEKKYLGEIMKGAPKQVEFRGVFPVEKIREIYEDMDALVIPSLWAENSPLVLLYALHTGTPVVAAKTGGIVSVTGDDGALFYPPGKPSELRKLLEGVLENRAAMHRLRKVGVVGMDEHVNKLIKIYGGSSS